MKEKNKINRLKWIQLFHFKQINNKQALLFQELKLLSRLETKNHLKKFKINQIQL